MTEWLVSQSSFNGCYCRHEREAVAEWYRLRYAGNRVKISRTVRTAIFPKSDVRQLTDWERSGKLCWKAEGK